jgi:hypothetical protein
LSEFSSKSVECADIIEFLKKFKTNSSKSDPVGFNDLRGIPTTLHNFYYTLSTSILEIPSFGNPLQIFSINEVFLRQSDYLGGSWNPTQFVFIDEGGYPVCTSWDDTRIYFGNRKSVKKQIIWEFLELSSDINSFLIGVSTYLDCYTHTIEASILDFSIENTEYIIKLFTNEIMILEPKNYQNWLKWMGMV